MMLIFLIFRAEAYTCWSARFARSWLVVLRDYLRKFRFFFWILVLFQFSVRFGKRTGGNEEGLRLGGWHPTRNNLLKDSQKN